MTLAVVIPYFQRTEGPLAAAVASVHAQRDVDDVRVVVVDDASPVRPEPELARVAVPARFPVDVVRQPNGGPAAARNRGLASLGPDVTRVAFLDSDDAWDDDHLARATRALDAGYDFYFADHFQLGQDVSAFARAKRLDLATHPSLAGDPTLHAYTGDMVDQIIRGNVIGTSTVVYDFTRFRAQRFDEAFYSAGEDYLFWIACARAGARFAFSSKPEVRYGTGVNVYSRSGWGTDGYLARIQNEMRYRKKLLALDLDRSQRDLIGERIAALRVEFADDLVHRAMHRKTIPADLLREQARLDWLTLAQLPIHAGQIVARRIRRRD